MSNNTSLARLCGYAGIAGIAVGVIAGILALMNPADVYLANPQGMPYDLSTSMGRIVVILIGIAELGFTASFLGFHFVGAVGNGLLGKSATVITAIGNLGAALGFIHTGLTGAESPLISISYILILGFILLTVAALREKKVSSLNAWMPVLIFVGLLAIELGIPANGITDMLHQAVYGAMSFVVLNELGKA